MKNCSLANRHVSVSGNYHDPVKTFYTIQLQKCIFDVSLSNDTFLKQLSFPLTAGKSPVELLHFTSQVLFFLSDCELNTLAHNQSHPHNIQTQIKCQRGNLILAY